MKKFTTTMATIILSALLCTEQFTTVANAFEIQDPMMYYDLNKDGYIGISDVVIAKKLSNDGKLSEKDVKNVCDYCFGNKPNVKFEEFDIDGMEVNDESIFEIQSICSSHCVDYEFDGECVRYRYLNDGVVTEMRCSSIDYSETAIAVLIYDGVQNVIGVTPERKFTIDTFKSFDVPHDFAEYEHWDFDECSIQFADILLKYSGKFDHFIVDSKLQGTTSVRFVFNDGITVTTLYLERIAPIEETLRSFVYEGEEISVGVTADGKIAMDTYSFDVPRNVAE